MTLTFPLDVGSPVIPAGSRSEWSQLRDLLPSYSPRHFSLLMLLYSLKITLDPFISPWRSEYHHSKTPLLAAQYFPAKCPLTLGDSLGKSFLSPIRRTWIRSATNSSATTKEEKRTTRTSSYRRHMFIGEQFVFIALSLSLSLSLSLFPSPFQSNRFRLATDHSFVERRRVDWKCICWRQ